MKTEKERQAIARGNELLAAVEVTISEVKSIEIPIGKIRELATAKAWAKNHGFVVQSAHSLRDSFGIEVRRAEDFEAGTLRREVLGKSKVSMLVGALKSTALAKQVPEADASDEEKREAQVARAAEFGIEAFVGLDEVLSFYDGGPQKLAQFGDPVNLFFPIDSAEHATVSRLAFRGRSADYAEEKSRAVVHERIVRAELALGVDPSFDPEDALDALLPNDLKDALAKVDGNLPETEFTKSGDLFFVEKNADGSDVPDDEVRMFGIVMKPEVPDCEGDVTSETEVQNGNFEFMKAFQTVGLMHAKDISDKVKIIQNVIAPVDIEFPLPDGTTKSITKGTWYQELWSNDPDIVRRVKVDKTLTGLSIGGFAQRVAITEMKDGEINLVVPDSYTPAQKRAIQEVVAKAEGDPALARFINLRVQEVSLVDAAANEEDYFFIKRRKDMAVKNETAADKSTQVAPVVPTTPAVAPATQSAPGTETPAVAPEVAPAEQTIAEQVAAGVKAGFESVLEAVTPAAVVPEVAPAAAAAPATAPAVAPVAPAAPAEVVAAKGEGTAEVLAELKKINERIDAVESTQTVTRAVAKGEAAPEGTESPADSDEPKSLWAGSVIHNAFGKKPKR